VTRPAPPTQLAHLDFDELKLPLEGLEADVQVILLLVRHLRIPHQAHER
jgi:hypothetical protein